MVIRAEIEELASKFNKSNHGIKVTVLESNLANIEILFSGILCATDGSCHEFGAFHKMLESMVGRTVNVKESKRISKTEHHVIYGLEDNDPADKILKILHQYDEGTPKRSEGFED